VNLEFPKVVCCGVVLFHVVALCCVMLWPCVVSCYGLVLRHVGPCVVSCLALCCVMLWRCVVSCCDLVLCHVAIEKLLMNVTDTTLQQVNSCRHQTP
jgi:hypothetical protein